MAQWVSTGINIKGPTGDTGPQGPAGQDGAGIEFSASVPTYADLPTGLGAGDAGDAYYVQADGRLYIWDGDSFPADGDGVEFRGEQGPQGESGPKGDTGGSGAPGTAATVTIGTVVEGGPAVTNSGSTSAAVLDFRIPKGDKGDTGDAGGQGVQGNPGVRGSLWYSAPSQPASNLQVGDMWVDETTGNLYRYE